jgi:hypothetical protein
MTTLNDPNDPFAEMAARIVAEPQIPLELRVSAPPPIDWEAQGSLVAMRRGWQALAAQGHPAAQAVVAHPDFQAESNAHAARVALYAHLPGPPVPLTRVVPVTQQSAVATQPAAAALNARVAGPGNALGVQDRPPLSGSSDLSQ